MKRLIRNRATLEYLQADGEWISDPDKAQSFVRVDLAIATARSRQLEGVDLVYLIQGRQGLFEEVFPLRFFHTAKPRDSATSDGLVPGVGEPVLVASSNLPAVEC